MRKKISLLFLMALLCVSGCSSHDAEDEGGYQEADSAYRFKQISMCDEQTGWALSAENEVLFTSEGTEKFSAVRKVEETDPDTDGFAGAAFVNEKTAYLVYFTPDSTHLKVEYTGDGGGSWQESLVDYSGFGDACDAGSAYLSFLDEQTGYLLYCSTPGTGIMKKILLRTEDGGSSFSLAADLSEQIAGYPQGISFGKDKGYIAVSYHGEDPYLYVSVNGGLTWEAETIHRTEEGVNYIDGYPPVFCSSDRNRGMLVLKTVGEATSCQVYVTGDGGENWTEAGTLPCESVSGYACVSEDDFFVIDGSGKLYKNR